MIEQDDFIIEAVRQAALPGHEIEPAALLGVVSSGADKLQLQFDQEQAAEIYKVLEREFGFVSHARMTGARTLADGDQKKLASCIRWIIRQLGDWRDVNDPQRHKLVTLFLLTGLLDRNGCLWGAVSPSPVNPALAEALAKMISGATVTFTARLSGPIPIWEQEVINELANADAGEDWVVLTDRWHACENAFFPNPILNEIAKSLYILDSKRLLLAVENLHSTPLAMSIADALSGEQRLSLAHLSNNAHLRFACAYRTVAAYPRPKVLDQPQQKQLTGLLLKIATEPQLWAAWMQVFNRYPARYPAFQKPLGSALACCKEAALAKYVESIDLFPLRSIPDVSRTLVADCLREFTNAAAPEQRKLLWTLAYERWRTWRFRFADPDSYLFGVNWSQIDFAVIGFAVECLDQNGRNNSIQEIRNKLGRVPTTWFPSESHFISEWNRLCSELQPYVHAGMATQTGGDWLVEDKIYSLTDFSTDYWKLMFEVR